MSKIELEATHKCDCCGNPIVQERDTDTRSSLAIDTFLKGKDESAFHEEWDLCTPCYKRFMSYMRRGAPKINWSNGTIIEDVDEPVSGG